MEDRDISDVRTRGDRARQGSLSELVAGTIGRRIVSGHYKPGETLPTEPRIQEEFVPQVEAAKWNAMDEDRRKEYVAALVEHGTARLEIHLRAPGVFEAKTFRVKRFRILLTPEMIGPDGQVTVTWNGKVVTKRPPRSRQVLAAEFAEHFDRSFLPVAEMMVP